MKKQLVTLLLISMLIFSCSDNRTAEQMFQDGSDQYKQEKISRSIKTFEKLSNIYPDDDLAVKASYHPDKYLKVFQKF